ncbi:hypothetical protein INT48_003793 [Thamnidium elegans]|uniref:Cytoplasmic tRNA 2-thiolation protein 2 n=1 Tax=Thamnidium elegans TaxID=101142 RepID=A0A8H7SSL9_9FUNG|nr:hypothetical protein INT48_003793 [Thamnidium elegans]
MKPSDKTCCKCKTEAATVLIRQAYYCQSCFMFTFVGKYRSILLRLRNGNRQNGKVLLACSGGPSSIAMVNLTKNFMRVVPTEKKKVQLIPEAIVCHIDESSLFENNKGYAEKLKENMEKDFDGFEYFSHRLEEVFGPEFTKSGEFNKILKSSSGGIENGEYEHFVQCVQNNSTKPLAEQLQTLFNSIKKTAAKEDLIWNLKMKMIVTVAKREGCSYIFMGDSATRQAIKMIAMTSKGRGYTLPLDIGVDNEISFKDICVMRPMKDMLSKEIGFYNYFSKIDKYIMPAFNFSTMMPAKSSIERLTEDFIVSIEREFSSTVSTICRTITKLQPSADMDLTKTCAMCLMPLESGIAEWRRHITVTDVEGVELPAKKDDGCCSTNECCSNTGGCSTEDKQSKIDMNKFMCYNCQVDLKDYNSTTIENLPPYMAESVVDQSRDNRLLDQIKDFLIDDDEE